MVGEEQASHQLDATTHRSAVGARQKNARVLQLDGGGDSGSQVRSTRAKNRRVAKLAAEAERIVSAERMPLPITQDRSSEGGKRDYCHY